MIRLFSGTSRNSRRRSKSVDRSDPKHGSRRNIFEGDNVDPLEKLRNVKQEVWYLTSKNLGISISRVKLKKI